jgi:hypothetical protein
MSMSSFIWSRRRLSNLVLALHDLVVLVEEVDACDLASDFDVLWQSVRVLLHLEDAVARGVEDVNLV